MKKLGRLFKNKVFLLATAALFLVFVWPARNVLGWLGFGSADKIKSLTNEVFMSMGTFGTKEKRLFELLEPLRAYELRKVFTEFGSKPYAMGGRLIGLGTSLNLFGWFNKELGKKDLDRMREIWQKSGLDLTF